MQKTALNRFSPLAKKSAAQIDRDKLWRKVKYDRAIFLAGKYGRVICEYCGRPAWGNVLGILDGHHIDKNRLNNTRENCYICHRICHSTIHDKNLRVQQLGFEGITWEQT